MTAQAGGARLSEELVAKAAAAIRAADDKALAESNFDQLCATYDEQARAVLDAVTPDLRAEGRRDALAEAAEARMAYSKELREAFREHNANRDLARLQPRRPDLRTWADALESTSHWLRARAEADPGERKAGS
jgi:hypothetical protein